MYFLTQEWKILTDKLPLTIAVRNNGICHAIQIKLHLISYTFSDGINPEITLTVEFVYQATALEQTHCNPTAKGIYTVLGQRVLATSTSCFPQPCALLRPMPAFAAICD